jgi:ferritin-like metal-binding protein YciE
MAISLSEAGRDVFVTGLKNAHAMENQALSIMRPQVERIENYPEVEEQLRLHIAETETQIQRIESILSGLGEGHNALKDAALSFAGGMAALGHTVAPDEILKNTFANHAFENFEAAAYLSLIALSQSASASDITALLQQSLDEELRMANWIASNTGALTLKYVSLREASLSAKR